MFYYVVCHTHFSVRATCLEQKHIFIKVLKVSFLDMKLIKDQVKMLKCCKTDLCPESVHLQGRDLNPNLSPVSFFQKKLLLS